MNMAKFTFCIITVAVCCTGVRSAKTCFWDEIEECKKDIVGGIDAIYNCNLIDELLDCYQDAVEGCLEGKTYNFPITRMFYKEFCKKGSELKIKSMKHKECLEKTFEQQNLKCHLHSATDEITDGISKSKPYTTNFRESFCKNKNAVSQCLLKKMEEECGIETRDVFDTILEVMYETSEVYCDFLKTTPTEIKTEKQNKQFSTEL